MIVQIASIYRTYVTTIDMYLNVIMQENSQDIVHLPVC